MSSVGVSELTQRCANSKPFLQSEHIINKIVVSIPVWDYDGGTGSNGYYHIVGFTGFQLTACNGGKDVEGVWRVPFSLDPTTNTPGFAGAPLAVQLIH
jgi:hypothetical protein